MSINKFKDKSKVTNLEGREDEPAVSKLPEVNEPKTEPSSSSADGDDSYTNDSGFPVGRLVAIARAEIGVKEECGNNRGKRIQEYQSASWLDGTGFPWCACWVDWIIRRWQKQCSMPYFERPQTAGAFDMVRWAKSQNLRVLDENSKAKMGDLIVFDFSHVGLVEKNQTGNYIQTIEGNVQPDKDEPMNDSPNGLDGVWRKTRYYTLVKAFIRWELTA